MTSPDAARTLRRSLRAIALRANLAHIDAQIEADRQRWTARGAPHLGGSIPGISRQTIAARRSELRAIESNRHGLAVSERAWGKRGGR